MDQELVADRDRLDQRGLHSFPPVRLIRAERQAPVLVDGEYPERDRDVPTGDAGRTTASLLLGITARRLLRSRKEILPSPSGRAFFSCSRVRARRV